MTKRIERGGRLLGRGGGAASSGHGPLSRLGFVDGLNFNLVLVPPQTLYPSSPRKGGWGVFFIMMLPLLGGAVGRYPNALGPAALLCALLGGNFLLKIKSNTKGDKMVEIQYTLQTTLTLGTLASADVIAASSKIDSSRLQGFRVSKVRWAGTYTGKTSGEGPIVYGMAANMTAAEIENAIEADPQASTEDDGRGDGSWLKPLGVISKNGTAGSLGPDGGSGEVCNFIDVKANWSVIEGKDFSFWAYNLHGSSLTTGSELQFATEFMGVWLRD